MSLHDASDHANENWAFTTKAEVAAYKIGKAVAENHRAKGLIIHKTPDYLALGIVSTLLVFFGVLGTLVCLIVAFDLAKTEPENVLRTLGYASAWFIVIFIGLIGHAVRTIAQNVFRAAN